jgi:hypothetical protein
VRVEEELPHHRVTEVALRLLDQQAIAVLHALAEVGERVLVAPRALDLAREPEDRRRLPDEVERDVGRRDVLLEDRSVPRPLRHPVPEHETVVAEPEQVLEECIPDRAFPRCRHGTRPEDVRRLARRDPAFLTDGRGHQKTRTPRGTL